MSKGRAVPPQMPMPEDTDSLALMQLSALFVDGKIVAPFAIMRVTAFDDPDHDLRSVLGLTDKLHEWDHPYPLWREFRQYVPAGRYFLWLIGDVMHPQNTAAGAMVLDTQLADRVFTSPLMQMADQIVRAELGMN